VKRVLLRLTRLRVYWCSSGLELAATCFNASITEEDGM